MLFFKLPDRCVYLKYCAGAFLLLNIVSAPSQYNISIIPFMLGLYLTVKVRYESTCKKEKINSLYDIQSSHCICPRVVWQLDILNLLLSADGVGCHRE